jgi:hypothetical protein
MSPRVTWRLVPDDPESGMPVLQTSLLPKYGDARPVWIRKVRTETSADGNGDVYIDYVLGESE